MPIILSPGVRVCDASDNPISGGKVRVYTANTTTLADLFSDPGLSVALTNPVVCNSAGYPTSDGGTTPTLIFAAEGTYDIAFLTAADAVSVSFPDTPTVGSATGNVERDFINSRYRVSGSGGVVSIEAGDPSPDDAGGDLRLGGWAGTQADTLELDGLAVDASGRYLEQGKKLDGTVYYDAVAWAAAATVSIPLPEDPTNCRAYEIDLFDVILSADAALSLRIAYDGVPTFKSGASDYAYQALYASSTSTVSSTEDPAHTEIYLGPAMRADGAAPITVHLNVICPDSGGFPTKIRFDVDSWQTAGTIACAARVTGVGWGIGGYGRPTHLQLRTSTGTMTGKYRLRALRGFGEA